MHCNKIYNNYYTTKPGDERWTMDERIEVLGGCPCATAKRGENRGVVSQSKLNISPLKIQLTWFTALLNGGRRFITVENLSSKFRAGIIENYTNLKIILY